MVFQARLLRLDKGDTLAPAALDMLLGSQMNSDVGGTITQVWVEDDWVMIEVTPMGVDEYDELMKTDYNYSVAGEEVK
jgi:hypothetical protein